MLVWSLDLLTLHQYFTFNWFRIMPRTVYKIHEYNYKKWNGFFSSINGNLAFYSLSCMANNNIFPGWFWVVGKDMKQRTYSVWGEENGVHPLLFLQFIYSLWASVFSPIEWRLYWLPYICCEDWIILFLGSTQSDISGMSPWRHWVIVIIAKNSRHNCGTYLCHSLKSH